MYNAHQKISRWALVYNGHQKITGWALMYNGHQKISGWALLIKKTVIPSSLPPISGVSL